MIKLLKQNFQSLIDLKQYPELEIEGAIGLSWFYHLVELFYQLIFVYAFCFILENNLASEANIPLFVIVGLISFLAYPLLETLKWLLWSGYFLSLSSLLGSGKSAKASKIYQRSLYSHFFLLFPILGSLLAPLWKLVIMVKETQQVFQVSWAGALGLLLLPYLLLSSVILGCILAISLLVSTLSL